MTRTDREKELEKMSHSPVGFAHLHRIWSAMRERNKLTEPRVGITGIKMAAEILDDEFPPT